ncbi:MAG: hypothetical protein KUA43_05320 [Hoeflea sp.]|uniref:hypothetical protein n=1 Tax=Hoeflea sp. TaxID=1940281 RepID=UPI001D6AC7E7|nr:hypothetical protein [Hoeflea sp.]MBU4530952.1 hypothetical protein [Alphaproteobacteria bacterium]MBU4542727.1 hypothetical protein [Alphaproteobacteria bacterium]MBU4549346.1 hypothetical protein [Alphaproteobacteria bacterium]MBV1722844.1 hypothetical protein [Hoeflea sp.]MBV1761566.1 hypothetical protein [Hoeflea sp.]
MPPVPPQVPPLAAPRVLPAWPGPGTINLAGELLSLSETTIATTATITLPETAPDFWAMLAAALPADRPE